MYKKLNFLLIFFISSFSIFAQEKAKNELDDDLYFAKLDSIYKEVKFEEISKLIELNLDTLRSGANGSLYYTAFNRLKFGLTYMGKKRKVPMEIKKTIVTVAKWRIGYDQANAIEQAYLEEELLFSQNGNTIWIPIQKNLVKAFTEEIQKGEEVFIYCMTFIERSDQQPIHLAFLIAEYQ